MADDEQFSLCWNNFNSNLSAGFHESLCRGDLVDVTLAAEGQFVKAHRLVLSVCSPYFRKMFTQMPANQHAFVFLKDVSHSALKDLIQFMYCGEVNVKQEALPAFISTAEALQIKGLTDSDPPPSQSPAKPSTPAPQPVPAQQQQHITSPRVRQRTSTSRSYKIESIDDSGDDNKQGTQIVIQTAAPPQQTQQTTIVQQQHHQQQQQLQHQQQQQPQQHHHQQQATTTVVSQKRPAAQRSISTPHTKRVKNTVDPLEANEPVTQQISVQTVVAESKTQSEPEFIDLPIELPTKSEPDYAEETGEVETAEQDTNYVEDDTYGDMRYDESYFTENEEAANTTAGGGAVGATTSKAIVKQQATSFSDSNYVDTADQSANEAQVKVLNKYLHKHNPFTVPPDSRIIVKQTVSLVKKEFLHKEGVEYEKLGIPTTSIQKQTIRRVGKAKSPIKRTMVPMPMGPVRPLPAALTKTPDISLDIRKPVQLSLCANFTSPENAVKTSKNKHTLTIIKKARLMGKCVQCIKKSIADKTQVRLPKILTYCPQCPGGDWICEPCFDIVHQ